MPAPAGVRPHAAPQQYAPPQQWAPPQQYAAPQQGAPQRPGAIPPGQPPAAPVRPSSPQPGFFARWNRRRRIASLVIGVVALCIRLATGDLFSHEGNDPRPIVLPESLGSSSRTTDTGALASASEHLAKTTEWWPGRPTGTAYYDSTAPALAARPASFRASAGAHVTAVRGQFHERGDAYIFDQLDKLAGKKIRRSDAEFGDNTCEWTSNDIPVTVCWRETDRLSMSVLLLDSTPAAEASQLLDEAWAAVG